jgi:hypothetical protein
MPTNKKISKKVSKKRNESRQRSSSEDGTASLKRTVIEDNTDYGPAMANVLVELSESAQRKIYPEEKMSTYKRHYTKLHSPCEQKEEETEEDDESSSNSTTESMRREREKAYELVRKAEERKTRKKQKTSHIINYRNNDLLNDHDKYDETRTSEGDKRISNNKSVTGSNVPTTEVIVMKETTVENVSYATTASLIENDTLKHNYLSACEDMGIIDTQEDIKRYYKNMTRKYGWKHFKIMDAEDYIFGSNFCKFMCKTLNKDINTVGIKEWWSQAKGSIQRSMQDMRSTCTQAMRKSFLGKFLHV